MSPRLALAALLLTALPAAALDITGIVINKNEQPIPLAQVCLKNNPTRCVVTAVQGTFRITDGASVRDAGAPPGYALQFLGSRLVLTVPAGVRGELEWHDASGRLLAPRRTLDLASGRNLVDLPALPRDGLHFLRLTVPGYTLAWKALLVGPAGGSRASARPLAALSKPSAALTDLVVTKNGFRPETYRPSREVEQGAIIVLTANADSGFVFSSLFKARNTIDKAAGRWVTEATVDTCNGTTAVPTVVKDTARFAVRDGKLYQYYEGACRGELMEGTGNDVIGAWTVKESDVYLPEDLRPATCKDTILSTPVPPTVKAKLTVSDTVQTFEISQEVCPPEIYLPLIAYFILTDTTIELTNNTCRNLAFKSGAGKTATIAFSRRGPDSLAYTFTADTATCTAVENMRQGEGVPTDCSGNDPAFAWLACVEATGFFGKPPAPRPLAKTALVPARIPWQASWRSLPWSGCAPARPAAPARSIFTPHGRFRLTGNRGT